MGIAMGVMATVGYNLKPDGPADGSCGAAVSVGPDGFWLRFVVRVGFVMCLAGMLMPAQDRSEVLTLLRPAAGGGPAVGVSTPGALPLLQVPGADAPRVMRERALEADGVAMRRLFRAELPVRRGAQAATARGTSFRTTRREAALPTIVLPLFPDTVFAMQPDQVLDHEGAVGPDGMPSGLFPDNGRRGRTLRGVLIAGGEGTAILSEYDGAISGSVRLANGEFYEWEMLPDADGIARGIVRQVEGTARWPGSDEVVLPDNDDRPSPVAGGKAPSLLEQSGARFAEGEKVITVAAYYTRRVLEARGGPSGLMAWLRRLEAESNEALRNSELDLEYRFVTAILVNHDDSQTAMSYSEALRTLRDVYDSQWRAVARARLGALFVAPPLPSSGGFTVGIAYLQNAFSDLQRHSVSHHLYAGGTSLTFAHEAGHNFGCVHDVDNDNTWPGGGLLGDSRGYQQRDLEPKFFTVMAYSCTGCRAVPYYSEPNVLYETIPTGVASTRCAATMARTATDTTWQGAPPPAGCIVSLHPQSFVLSAAAQDIHIEVRTEAGCSWQPRVAMGGDANFVSDYFPGQTRTGPGWLRLQVAPSSGGGERPRNTVWDVRGTPLRISQNLAGVPALSVSQQLLRFQASSRPDIPQQRCVTVSHSAGAGRMEVRTVGLPTWLSFDRVEGNAPGILCAQVNPRGLSAGRYRAAPVISTGGALPSDLLLQVELEVAASVTPVLLSPRALGFRASAADPITAIQKLEVSGLADVAFPTVGGFPHWLRVRPEAHPDGYRLDVWADATGLAPGVHTANLLVGCPADACAARAVPLHFTVEDSAPAGPRIVSGGVVNAADFTPGLSTGSWMSVFGVNLASTTRGWAEGDFLGNLLPITLDGVRVIVDGYLAAVSFISPNQVNFQVPEMERTGWVPVEVVTPEGRDRHWAYVEAENPGLFLLNGFDVAALHEDATPVAMDGALGPGVSTRPARPGDLLSLYGTGFGRTTPRVIPGLLYQGAARIQSSNPVRVTVGGELAEILFAGQSGAGLNQINFRVPNLPPGDHPVRVTVGATPAAWRGTLRVE